MGSLQDNSNDDRYIIWLDIDNTLYSASARISHAMGERIHAYFLSLGFPDEEASELHHKYYTQYGLALRGLVRHHEIDPLDFDRKCDGSLPLEDMLQRDPKLHKLLEDIDRSKARVWALTNAYKTHAQRVLRILGVEDQIEGLVYCDYANPEFSCKPEPEYFHNALQQAQVQDPSKCCFVDDSRMNVHAARQLGWGRCVHFCEQGLTTVEGGKPKEIGKDTSSGTNDSDLVVISDLEELRTIWADLFKPSAN
ncbi:pyrimidine 5-nucleotidase [Laetiporus sulphureus 93-53]|uniref:Pyrimidine 5-nucleotidase n=1 Tax=Laetiporus sulphureus 93-53 TaxID=1314785 RepID=A0A165I2H7_9APHY|nr:pyrimidine 5-nucleotidase [Laetiporus sulphureus 93-53]KZT12504.1 pyrimidine 5-nucleotidase [Laetiporus sulphureus 93-53]